MAEDNLDALRHWKKLGPQEVWERTVGGHVWTLVPMVVQGGRQVFGLRLDDGPTRIILNTPHAAKAAESANDRIDEAVDQESSGWWPDVDAADAEQLWTIEVSDTYTRRVRVRGADMAKAIAEAVEAARAPDAPQAIRSTEIQIVGSPPE